MKKNKKLVNILFLCILLIGFIIFICCLIYKNRTNITLFLNRKKLEYLKSERIIYLNELGLDDLVVTGITYDNKNDSFWLADYGNTNGHQVFPRIIEVDIDFKKIKSIIKIDNNNNDINLQGIAYSYKEDSLWIASGNKIINIDKKGNVLKEYETKNKYDCISNGISYYDESIDILCYKKYLIKMKKDGTIIYKKNINHKNQDHIYNNKNKLYLTVGANYQGNNYVFVMDENELSKIYVLEDSYAIEGITFYNDKMYITNDGNRHSAKINKNYIAIYSLE